MNKILITILLGLNLISCSPKLYPTQTIEVENTVTEKEIIRDTIIQVQPDSSMIRALIQCDSTGRAHLQELQTLRESARLQQTITIDQDPKSYEPTSLIIQAKVDSMGIYLTYKERLKEETKTEIQETVIEKKVNILKPYQKFLMNVGAIAIAGLILLLILKLRNLFK